MIDPAQINALSRANWFYGVAIGIEPATSANLSRKRAMAKVASICGEDALRGWQWQHVVQFVAATTLTDPADVEMFLCCLLAFPQRLGVRRRDDRCPPAQVAVRFAGSVEWQALLDHAVDDDGPERAALCGRLEA